MSNIIHQFRMRRALNALASGNYAEARRIWEKLAKSKRNSQGIRHNIALTYIAEARFEEAEPLLRAEIEDYGEFYARVRAMADMYYAWGKPGAAARWYRRALEQHDCPDTERDFMDRRIELAGDPQKFSDTQDSQRKLQEGNVLLAQGRWQEAREVFERAVELDPTNIQAINNIGTILLNHEKDPEAAIEYFEKALGWADLPWLRKNLSAARKAMQ